MLKFDKQQQEEEIDIIINLIVLTVVLKSLKLSDLLKKFPFLVILDY